MQSLSLQLYHHLTCWSALLELLTVVWPQNFLSFLVAGLELVIVLLGPSLCYFGVFCILGPIVARQVLEHGT